VDSVATLLQSMLHDESSINSLAMLFWICRKYYVDELRWSEPSMSVRYSLRVNRRDAGTQSEADVIEKGDRSMLACYLCDERFHGCPVEDYC